MMPDNEPRCNKHDKEDCDECWYHMRLFLSDQPEADFVLASEDYFGGCRYYMSLERLNEIITELEEGRDYFLAQRQTT